jgi:hypothetical protein
MMLVGLGLGICLYICKCKGKYTQPQAPVRLEEESYEMGDSSEEELLFQNPVAWGTRSKTTV